MKPVFLMLFVSVQIFAQPVLYPLHIGDTWQYKYFTIPPTDTNVYSQRVVSDTMLDGRTYAAIAFNNHPPTSFERQSGDSIFVHPPFDKEFLYFDFSRSVGDTVSSTPFGGDTMDVVLSETYVGTYFGSPRRVWVFSVNQDRHTIDDEYAVVVAESLGIVQNIPSFGDPQYLVGAIINGRVYGTVVGAHQNSQLSPEEFALLQNFPNPFNPSTTIEFALPHSSRVTIQFYNAIGQLIREFDYLHLPAGINRHRFDASFLSSGVYYYRVNTVVGTKTGKMLLEK